MRRALPALLAALFPGAAPAADETAEFVDVPDVHLFLVVRP